MERRGGVINRGSLEAIVEYTGMCVYCICSMRLSVYLLDLVLKIISSLVS